MMLRVAFPGVMLAACLLLLAGCGGAAGAGCGDPGRYANSRSAAPLRVPDDLSLPDESDSLSVPPPARGAAAEDDEGDGHCLEQPPDFSNKPKTASDASQSSASGAKGTSASRDKPRRKRRQAKRG